MKHQKKNTRRRHKSRNKTRKTRKPYKRCRTRRGGNPKEEVLKKILAQYKGSIIPIPSYFINYETFNNFLDVYGASELQKVVCGDYSEEAIRLHETQYLNTIKQAVAKVSNPIPKIIFIKDLFLTPKFINSWTDFVISLKNSVDARYSDDLKERMDVLKEYPLKPQPPPPQLHPGLAIPLPKRVLPRPASIIPGSEVDKRPYPPPGFTLKGNVYENEKGESLLAEYYKPLPAPASPAPAAPAPPAPAHRAPLTGKELRNAFFALSDD